MSFDMQCRIFIIEQKQWIVGRKVKLWGASNMSDVMTGGHTLLLIAQFRTHLIE